MPHDTLINSHSTPGFANQHAHVQNRQKADMVEQRVSTETENEQDTSAHVSFRDELHQVERQSEPPNKMQASEVVDTIVADQGDGRLPRPGQPSTTTLAQPNHIAANSSDPDQAIRFVTDVGTFSSDVTNLGNVETVDSNLVVKLDGLDPTISSQRNSNNETAVADSAIVSSTVVAAKASQAVLDQEANSLLVPGAGLENSTKSQVEPVASGSGFQSDLSDSPQHPFEANRPGPVLESASRFISETAARTDSFVSTAAETGRAVSQRVSEVMIQEVQVSGNNEFKRITLHLHPAELGKLTLQVGWETESIIARIVASELATSELLNGDKTWLIETLQEHGVELDSLDISHGGTHDEPDFAQHKDADATRNSPGSNSSKTEPESNHSIEVDGVIVNLIA